MAELLASTLRGCHCGTRAVRLPNDTAAIVLVAGTLAWAGDLIDQVDGLWSRDDAAAAERWQRDKPLLDLGKEARRQRTLNAWMRVDAGAPAA